MLCKFCVVMLYLVLGVMPAWAADPVTPIQVVLTAHRILVSDGKESAQPAKTVKPGETVEYRAAYLNRGLTAVKGLLATLPIPDNGAELLIASIQPTGALASVDGVHFEAIPLKRWVRLPNGQKELRNVPISEYRFLRWNLGNLAVAQAVEVRSRVRIAQAALGVAGEQK